MDSKPDYFKDNAREWDKKKIRVLNAQNIASKIKEEIHFSGSESIVDFGAGTGLLSEAIAQKVYKISAIDYSGPMLEEFAKKKWPCKTETLNIDLTKGSISHQFDGIISSMTLHHIKDIPGLLQKFYDMLSEGAFIALADLEKEDGSFHSSNVGVEHFGFDLNEFNSWLIPIGFKDIKFSTANVIRKEIEGEMKDFPIFLVTAYK